MSTEKKSYSREIKEKLLERLRLMAENCTNLVGEKIDEELKDDKLFNALKGQRQAAEDAQWAAQQVDVLESELNEEKKKAVGNFAETMAGQ